MATLSITDTDIIFDCKKEMTKCDVSWTREISPMTSSLKTSNVLSHQCITTPLFSLSSFPKSSGKEPCQTSQTSLEVDQPPDTPTTPSPTTPVPSPRKGAEPDTPTEEQPGSGMVVPVPLPRQNLPPKDPEELGDKLADEVTLESEKSESEASTKTSSSDSGIEDGKSTPTSEEEKVPFEVVDLENEIFLYLLVILTVVYLKLFC